MTQNVLYILNNGNYITSDDPLFFPPIFIDIPYILNNNENYITPDGPLIFSDIY
jgi:hypothetical protein